MQTIRDAQDAIYGKDRGPPLLPHSEDDRHERLLWASQRRERRGIKRKLGDDQKLGGDQKGLVRLERPPLTAKILPASELPTGFPPELAYRALAAYALLRTLSVPLHLSPFTANVFLRALLLPYPNKLLGEIHVALLRLLLQSVATYHWAGKSIKSGTASLQKYAMGPLNGVQKKRRLDGLRWPLRAGDNLEYMDYFTWPIFFDDYAHLSADVVYHALQQSKHRPNGESNEDSDNNEMNQEDLAWRYLDISMVPSDRLPDEKDYTEARFGERRHARASRPSVLYLDSQADDEDDEDPDAFIPPKDDDEEDHTDDEDGGVDNFQYQHRAEKRLRDDAAETRTNDSQDNLDSRTLAFTNQEAFHVTEASAKSTNHGQTKPAGLASYLIDPTCKSIPAAAVPNAMNGRTAEALGRPWTQESNGDSIVSDCSPKLDPHRSAKYSSVFLNHLPATLSSETKNNAQFAPRRNGECHSLVESVAKVSPNNVSAVIEDYAEQSKPGAPALASQSSSFVGDALEAYMWNRKPELHKSSKESLGEDDNNPSNGTDDVEGGDCIEGSDHWAYFNALKAMRAGTPYYRLPLKQKLDILEFLLDELLCLDFVVNEMNARNERTSAEFLRYGLLPTTGELENLVNGDFCSLCLKEGDLICCDGCPSSYHTNCLGLSSAAALPPKWFCHECQLVDPAKFGSLYMGNKSSLDWVRTSDILLPQRTPLPLNFSDDKEYLFIHGFVLERPMKAVVRSSEEKLDRVPVPLRTEELSAWIERFGTVASRKAWPPAQIPFNDLSGTEINLPAPVNPYFKGSASYDPAMYENKYRHAPMAGVLHKVSDAHRSNFEERCSWLDKSAVSNALSPDMTNDQNILEALNSESIPFSALQMIKQYMFNLEDILVKSLLIESDWGTQEGTPWSSQVRTTKSVATLSALLVQVVDAAHPRAFKEAWFDYPTVKDSLPIASPGPSMQLRIPPDSTPASESLRRHWTVCELAHIRFLFGQEKLSVSDWIGRHRPDLEPSMKQSKRKQDGGQVQQEYSHAASLPPNGGTEVHLTGGLASPCDDRSKQGYDDERAQHDNVRRRSERTAMSLDEAGLDESSANLTKQDFLSRAQQRKMMEVCSSLESSRLADAPWPVAGRKFFDPIGRVSKEQVRRLARRGGCVRAPFVAYSEVFEVGQVSYYYIWRKRMLLCRSFEMLVLQTRVLQSMVDNPTISKFVSAVKRIRKHSPVLESPVYSTHRDIRNGETCYLTLSKDRSKGKWHTARSISVEDLAFELYKRRIGVLQARNKLGMEAPYVECIGIDLDSTKSDHHGEKRSVGRPLSSKVKPPVRSHRPTPSIAISGASGGFLSAGVPAASDPTISDRVPKASIDVNKTLMDHCVACRSILEAFGASSFWQICQLRAINVARVGEVLSSIRVTGNNDEVTKDLIAAENKALQTLAQNARPGEEFASFHGPQPAPQTRISAERSLRSALLLLSPTEAMNSLPDGSNVNPQMAYLLASQNLDKIVGQHEHASRQILLFSGATSVSKIHAFRSANSRRLTDILQSVGVKFDDTQVMTDLLDAESKALQFVWDRVPGPQDRKPIVNPTNGGYSGGPSASSSIISSQSALPQSTEFSAYQARGQDPVHYNGPLYPTNQANGAGQYAGTVPLLQVPQATTYPSAGALFPLPGPIHASNNNNAFPQAAFPSTLSAHHPSTATTTGWPLPAAALLGTPSPTQPSGQSPLNGIPWTTMHQPPSYQRRF